MKNRTIWLLAFLIILSMPIVAAEDEVHLLVNKINNQITQEQTATFTLTITNNNDFHDKYFLTIKDLDWNLQTIPIIDFTSGIEVNAKSSASTTLVLKPSDIIKPNIYYLEIIARSEKTGKSYSTFVSVNILPMVYEPKIEISIESPEKIDPKKLTTIKLILKNKNPRNFNDDSLDVTLETMNSNLLNKKIKTGLKSSENKIIEFSVLMNQAGVKNEAKSDTLKATVSYNGSILSTSKFPIELIPHFTVFKREHLVTKETLKTIDIYELSNDGPVEKKEDFTVETSRLKNLFSYTEPKARLLKQDGNLNYLWTIKLNPGERTRITITTSYRPLVWLVVLALIIIVFYSLLRSPLVIYKEVRDVEMKEGGISELKVVLRLKNRSSKKVLGVRLIDRIPNIAEPIKQDGVETIKPDKYFKYENGLALDWHFAHLEPKEERVITYKIRSRLSVLGDFKLPQALAQYSSGKTKRKTYSNTVDVFSA